MGNKFFQKRKDIFIWIIICVAVLGIVGFLMQNRMWTLLHNYMENKVTEQAGVLAELCEERILLKLDEMEHVAEYIEWYGDSEQIVKYMQIGHEWENTGKDAWAMIYNFDVVMLYGESHRSFLRMPVYKSHSEENGRSVIKKDRDFYCLFRCITMKISSMFFINYTVKSCWRKNLASVVMMAEDVY